MTTVYPTGWQGWDKRLDRPGVISRLHLTMSTSAKETLCGRSVPSDAEGSISTDRCKVCYRVARRIGADIQD